MRKHIRFVKVFSKLCWDILLESRSLRTTFILAFYEESGWGTVDGITKRHSLYSLAKEVVYGR